MKIIHLNHSDINGGAARAAYRIHHAVRQQGMDSRMWVDNASAGDWTVEGPQTKWRKGFNKLRPALGGVLTRTLKTGNPIIHSPSILPSRWRGRLNASDADVIHLHWINGEMISIADIAQTRKPVVWTLHDMWAFCGAEHVTEDFRWRDGYTTSNRPAYESGFDLNRWVWRRKLKAWRRPMQIVTPSRWLAECAQQSVLMRDWPVSVIPNAIDTEIWRPIEKSVARGLMGLPADGHILLFGTFGANSAPHKGFDLLRSALAHLHGQVEGLQLVVFGQLAPRHLVDLGFPVHYAGHLHDDLSLRVLYSAADAIVVPSRQESFGQTASEALACGTPVVAFGATGLLDVVRHQQTGYLAKPYDAEDLAHGVRWILADSERHTRLCVDARDDAVSRFSYPVVAKQYLAVYEAAIESARG